MFLSPVFLIAAGVGAAIPLVLHLMRSRRPVPLKFPTLRFLLQAQQQTSRQLRMENLLLWLLRTLILLLIGLSFAMPTLRTRRMAWLGEAPRDVALVVDTSASMDYRVGRQTVWERAQEAAAAITGQLGENDRLCVFLAGERPEALVAEPSAAGKDALATLKARSPARATSSLAPALAAATEALKKGGDGREREIYLFTDNQSLPWRSFSGGTTGAVEVAASSKTPESTENVAPTSDLRPLTSAPATTGVASNAPTLPAPRSSLPTSSAWNPGMIDARTTVFACLLGVPAPQNVTPSGIDLQPRFMLRDTPGRVLVEMQSSGSVGETTVALFVDDREVSRRPVLLGAQDAPPPVFTLPGLPPGLHPARLETPDDNLPADNALHFLVRVQDRLPALCVGAPADTLFVRAALKAGTGGGEPKVVSTDDLAGEALASYSSVFLCNALPLPGQTIAALEQYVRDGGLLVIFPGGRATIADYPPWTCLPGRPSAVIETAQTDRKRTLSWNRPAHPMLRPMRTGMGVPSLSILRHLAWEKLEPDAESVASLFAGQPFLLDRPFGNGRVLLFAVSADRAWSGFPLSPYFLPFVVQAVEYGAIVGGHTPFLWGGDSIALDGLLPPGAADAGLLDPSGRPVSIRTALVEGRTRRYAESVTEPGIYRLDGAERPAAFAVNMSRRESDLTPVVAADLPRLLGLPNLQVATDKEGLLQRVAEHRTGRTYGEHLLWLALVLAIVEFTYANVLMRAAPRASDHVDVEVSGRVRHT